VGVRRRDEMLCETAAIVLLCACGQVAGGREAATTDAGNGEGVSPCSFADPEVALALAR
jgi:hypothetical protein